MPQAPEPQPSPPQTPSAATRQKVSSYIASSVYRIFRAAAPARSRNYSRPPPCRHILQHRAVLLGLLRRSLRSGSGSGITRRQKAAVRTVPQYGKDDHRQHAEREHRAYNSLYHCLLLFIFLKAYSPSRRLYSAFCSVAAAAGASRDGIAGASPLAGCSSSHSMVRLTTLSMGNML